MLVIMASCFGFLNSDLTGNLKKVPKDPLFFLIAGSRSTRRRAISAGPGGPAHRRRLILRSFELIWWGVRHQKLQPHYFILKIKRD